jgi:hypothetical protein
MLLQAGGGSGGKKIGGGTYIKKLSSENFALDIQIIK